MKPRVVLLRVYGVDEEHTFLLPEKQIEPDQDRDERAQTRAAALGVVPPETSTGTNVVQNARLVDVSTMFDELLEVGYRIAKAHWFWKNEAQESRVIEIVFNEETEEQVDLPEPIRLLLQRVFGWCNVWVNVVDMPDQDLFRLDSINISNPWDIGTAAERRIRVDFPGSSFVYPNEFYEI